jgi:predicted nucleic acid-binding protein
MAWVVDSCILLDVALRDPAFGLPSALLLDGLRGEGLVVCPVSVIELTPQFGGRIENVREFLALMGADPHVAWLEADTENAAAGWTRYVALKRAGSVSKRPVADLLIGSFASRFQGLVTRNPQHFLPFFPELVLRQPVPSALTTSR